VVCGHIGGVYANGRVSVRHVARHDARLLGSALLLQAVWPEGLPRWRIENDLQHWLYGFEVLLLVALFVSPYLQMDGSLWTTLLCIMFFGEIIFIGKSIIPYAVYWHG
jgi:hypothetical protein